MIGKLINLSLTQPNLAYFVSVANQYIHSLTQTHFNAAMHILKYLKGTYEKGLQFQKSENKEIVGFVNANWASSQQDSRSTSSFCTKLWRNLVAW